ncbi:MAG: PLDc N-terminal domain-containing protein, partial [Gemmiger sp.]
MQTKPRRVFKELLGRLFSRPVVTALLLLAQVFWMFAIWRWLMDYSRPLTIAGVVLSVLMCMALIRKDSTVPEFKIAWMVLFMLMPVQGGLLYLMWGDKRPAFYLRRKLEKAAACVAVLRRGSTTPQQALEQADPRAGATARYLRDYGPCPVYGNTTATYYPSGEAMFPDLLAALESARKYIFIEMFILGAGEMWEAMHAILRRKAE